MSPRHTPVFFYGLFMDPDLLRARGLAPANYAHPGVAAYRPEAVVAEAADGAVAALCYNLPEAPAPGETDPAYAASLRELAARLGLPAEYVDRIR
jgi:hypothetical protein